MDLHSINFLWMRNLFLPKVPEQMKVKSIPCCSSTFSF